MARPAHITAHSIKRYRERVENLPDDEIRERLSSPVIMAAIASGFCGIRLPNGAKVVISKDGKIVTVKPSQSHNRPAGRK